MTPANVADLSQLPDLPRKNDRAVLGDAKYVHDTFKREVSKVGMFLGVVLKARSKRRLCHETFGYRNTRYWQIAKNAAQVFTLIGLTNLYLKRHALMKLMGEFCLQIAQPGESGQNDRRKQQKNRLIRASTSAFSVTPYSHRPNSHLFRVSLEYHPYKKPKPLPETVCHLKPGITFEQRKRSHAASTREPAGASIKPRIATDQ